MPARDDPFRLFAGHATGRFTADMRIALRADAPRRVADVAGGTAATFLVPATLLREAQIDAILDQLGDGPMTVAELIRFNRGMDQRLVGNSLGWLLKYGFCEIVD